MAGYSSTPLPQKLGIKANTTITVINYPGEYQSLVEPLPLHVTISAHLTTTQTFIHFFTKNKKELEMWFPKLKKHLATNGILWISWPKGRSLVKTDMNENDVREIGLKNGLVDTKVAAIDEVWSGLKFVYRIKDRLHAQP